MPQLYHVPTSRPRSSRSAREAEYEARAAQPDAIPINAQRRRCRSVRGPTSRPPATETRRSPATRTREGNLSGVTRQTRPRSTKEDGSRQEIETVKPSSQTVFVLPVSINTPPMVARRPRSHPVETRRFPVVGSRFHSPKLADRQAESSSERQAMTYDDQRTAVASAAARACLPFNVVISACPVPIPDAPARAPTTGVEPPRSMPRQRRDPRAASMLQSQTGDGHYPARPRRSPVETSPEPAQLTDCQQICEPPERRKPPLSFLGQPLGCEADFRQCVCATTPEW